MKTTVLALALASCAQGAWLDQNLALSAFPAGVTSHAMAGDVLVIGSIGDNDRAAKSGAIGIYEKGADGNYALSIKIPCILASDSSHFGYVVATDGVTVLASRRQTPKVRSFRKDGAGVWQETNIPTSNSVNYGNTLAVSGDYAAIGIPSASAGSVKVYKYDSNTATWKLTETLYNTLFGSKSTYAYKTSSYLFGDRLALNGDVLVVRYTLDISTHNHYGLGNKRLGVFERLANMEVWASTASFTGSSTTAACKFADAALAVNDDGNTIVAPDTMSNRNRAYVFERVSSGHWTRNTNLLPLASAGSATLKSMALSGDTVAVSVSTGDVHFFKKINDAWTETDVLVGAPVVYDIFGYLSMSGMYITVKNVLYANLPSPSPTKAPSAAPTAETTNPSATPTEAPTSSTTAPSVAPTMAPTAQSAWIGYYEADTLLWTESQWLVEVGGSDLTAVDVFGSCSACTPTGVRVAVDGVETAVFGASDVVQTSLDLVNAGAGVSTVTVVSTTQVDSIKLDVGNGNSLEFGNVPESSTAEVESRAGKAVCDVRFRAGADVVYQMQFRFCDAA